MLAGKRAEKNHIRQREQPCKGPEPGKSLDVQRNPGKLSVAGAWHANTHRLASNELASNFLDSLHARKMYEI